MSIVSTCSSNMSMIIEFVDIARIIGRLQRFSKGGVGSALRRHRFRDAQL